MIIAASWLVGVRTANKDLPGCHHIQDSYVVLAILLQFRIRSLDISTFSYNLTNFPSGRLSKKGYLLINIVNCKVNRGHDYNSQKFIGIPQQSAKGMKTYKELEE